MQNSVIYMGVLGLICLHNKGEKSESEEDP